MMARYFWTMIYNHFMVHKAKESETSFCKKINKKQIKNVFPKKVHNFQIPYFYSQNVRNLKVQYLFGEIVSLYFQVKH